MQGKEAGKKRGKRLRSAGGTIALALILAAAGAYFFLTSSWAIVNIYLKAGSYFAGIDLAAERAEWNPWKKELRFYNFRIGEKDFPWVEGSELAGKYHIRDILNGEIRWSAISMKSGTARIIISQNLADTLLRDYRPPAEDTFSWLNRFDLRRMKVSDCRLCYFERSGGVLREKFELYGADGTLSSLRPGAEGVLDIAGSLRMRDFNGINIDRGKFKINASAGLGRYLIPERLTGKLALTGCHGMISGKKLHGNSVELLLDCSRIPSQKRIEVKKFFLEEQHGGEVRSRMSFSGEICRSPFALKSDFEVEKISPEAVSMLCQFGWSFNPGQVTFKGRGGFEYSSGKTAGHGEFSLKRTGMAFFGGTEYDLPPAEMEGVADFAVDFAQCRSRISRMDFSLSGEGIPVAGLHLQSPVEYSWKEAGSADFSSSGSSSQGRIDFVCRRFDLRLLRLIPQLNRMVNIGGGWFDAELKGHFSGVGSGVVFSGSAGVDDLYMKLPELNAPEGVKKVDINCRIDGMLTRGMEIKLHKISGEVTRMDRHMGDIESVLDFNLWKNRYSGKVAMNKISPEIISSLVPKESLAAVQGLLGKIGKSSGTMSLAFGCTGYERVLSDWRMAWTAPDMGVDLKAEAGRMVFRRGKRLPEDSWRIGMNVIFPAELLRQYQIHGIEHMDGIFSAEAALDFGRDFSRLELSGKAGLRDGGVSFRGGKWEKLGAEGKIAVKSDDLEHFSVEKLDFLVSQDNQGIFRAEFPFRFSKDKLHGTFSLRYLNERGLELLCPGIFDRSSIGGTADIAVDSFSGKRWKSSGKLSAASLRLRGAEDNISGWMAFSAESTPSGFRLENAEAELRSGGQTVLDGKGSCRYAAEEDEKLTGVLELELLSGALLQKTVLNIYDMEEEKAHPEEEKEEILQFDLAECPFRFDVSVKRLFWKNGAVFLSSVVSGRDREIALRDVICSTGRGHVKGDWHFVCVPGQGVACSASGRNYGRMPLEVLLCPLVEWPGSSGELEKLQWDFKWMLGRRWSRTLEGRLDAGIGAVVLSNNLAAGVLGRLIFLPAELILRLSSIFPKDVASAKSWEKALRTAGAVKSHARTIDFDDGTVVIRAGDGKLTVNKFALNGQSVKLLSFDGEIDIAGEGAVDLRSQIRLSGVELPLRIGGTLSSPQLRLISVLPDALISNAVRMIRTLDFVFNTEHETGETKDE